MSSHATDLALYAIIFFFCVTVTEALVLRPLLEDRRRITESIRILVPVERMKQECFQITMKRVRDRSSFSSVASLFHARDAATEKALSPILRRVRGTTRLPHDEARSVRPGILATDVRRSEIYSGVCPTVPQATCEPASTACTGSS